MPILFISVAVGVFFAVLGGLIWLILFFFHVRKHAWKTIRVTMIAYLIVLPLVIFALIPLLFSFFVANASTRPQDRNLSATPGDLQRPFRAVEFWTRDGYELRGWLLPGDDTRPSIAFGHGLFRSRHEVLERGCRINELGYPVLVYDFRGHGQSQKAPITVGYQERLDVLAARDFLLSESSRQVVVAGVSMGAVASLMAAAESPEGIVGLIADSPFETLRETVSRHAWLFLSVPSFPFADLFVWNLSRLGSFDPADLDTLAAAMQLKETPILFIYGREDRRMPAKVAENLLAAAASPHKRLVFFDGARHGGAFKARPDLYVKIVGEFLASLVC